MYAWEKPYLLYILSIKRIKVEIEFYITVYFGAIMFNLLDYIYAQIILSVFWQLIHLDVNF